ncbi:MAG TPA: hypothetical protein VFX22_11710, partial [Candidatus Kapabacteria bacterium]|nr:hypothetical protein [Candidatus Kapabacteria bacterium]
MKIVLLGCVGLCLAFASRSEAQTVHDSTGHGMIARSVDSSEDEQARKILDYPGAADLDPDETMEYLDGLSSVAATGLALLHANPDVSWTEAHASLRADDTARRAPNAWCAPAAAAPGKFYLRSR